MGKNIKSEQLLVSIIVDGSPVKKEMKEVEDSIKSLRSENGNLISSQKDEVESRKKTRKEMQKYSLEIKELTSAQDKLNKKNKKATEKYENNDIKIKELTESNKKLAKSRKANREEIRRNSSEIEKLSFSQKELNKETKKATSEYQKIDVKIKELAASKTVLNTKVEQSEGRTKQYTQSIKENSLAITENDKKLDKLRDSISLTDMSVKELRREYKKFKRFADAAVPNSASWVRYRAELEKVDARLKELGIQGQQTAQKISMSSVRNGANRAYGVITAGIASVTGAFFGASSAAEKFRERDDVYADVLKTTNLLRDEVVGLNEDLKNIDTRTAQNELLGLVEVGGKLGLRGEETLLGFAKAADVLKVSLAKDLGEDPKQAIGEIGKIVGIFGLLDDMKIDEAMLKIGSSINDVGASSTASERYVVNFLYRIGAVSNQVKQSAADAIGLASLLDTRGQRSEMASTAVSRLMREMTIDTTSFAKIAKMELSEYIELVDTDFNTAFVKVLQSFSKLDAAGLSTTLATVGLTGTEAVGVITALSASTEDLVKHQKIANDAFRDGTSVMIEFSTKNNSEEAKHEKRLRDRAELIVELGGKLNGVIATTTDSSILGLKALISLIDFMGEYSKAFIPVTIAIAGYIIKTKIATLHTKLLGTEFVITSVKLKGLRGAALFANAGLAKLIKGFKTLTLAIKTNPITFFIGLIVAGVTALIAFSKKAETAAESIERINKSAEKAVSAETRAIQLLLIELEDELTAKERKIEILEQLRIAMGKGTTAVDKETLSMAKARKEAEKFLKIKELTALNDGIDKEIASTTNEKANYRLSPILDPFRILFKSVSSDKSIKDLANQMIADRTVKFDDKLIELNAEKTKNTNKLNTLNTDSTGTVGGEIERINIEIEKLNAKKLTLKFDDKDGIKEINDEIKVYQEKLAELKNPQDPIGVLDSGTIGGEIERITKLIEDLNAERLTIKVTDKGAIKEIDDEVKQLTTDLSKLNEPTNTTKSKDYTKNQTDFLVSKSPIEQEKASYKERLKELGLFNKQKEDMSELEKKVLASLEQEHHDNIASIERDVASSKINADIALLDDLIAIKKSQHLRELADITLTAEERKALEIKHQEELSQALISGYDKILTELNPTKNPKTWGDMILTEEQTEVILDLLRKIEDKKNKVLVDNTSAKPAEPKKGGAYGALNDKSRSTTIPIIGGTAGEWEDAINTLEGWDAASVEGKAQVIAKSFQVVGAAFGAMNQLMTAAENKELDNFAKNQKNKENILKRQLDSGAISQDAYNAKMTSMQAEMDKKREEADIKQAKRNKVQAILDAMIATSVAVATALPNIPLSIVVGALGLAQVAMIAAIPVASGYEKGGYTMRDDGKLFKTKNSGRKSGYVGATGAEYIVGEYGKEEFIVNNKSLQDPTIASLMQSVDHYQRKGYFKAPIIPSRGYQHSRSATKNIKNTKSTNDVVVQKNSSENNDLAKKTLVALEALTNRLNNPIEAVISNKKLEKSQAKYNKAKKKL